MINQKQLKSTEETMVDAFQVEELESRLEMCGNWNEDACPDPDPGGGDCSLSGGTDPDTGKCFPPPPPANY
jgi:hypothetical protein